MAIRAHVSNSRSGYHKHWILIPNSTNCIWSTDKNLPANTHYHHHHPTTTIPPPPKKKTTTHTQLLREHLRQMCGMIFLHWNAVFSTSDQADTNLISGSRTWIIDILITQSLQNSPFKDYHTNSHFAHVTGIVYMVQGQDIHPFSTAFKMAMG